VRIGLIGGSFDPIHRGHLEPVRAARERCGLDRVIYLPTSDPPHKPERRFAPAWRRYVMVELALLGEEGLEASPLELTPGRQAYTVDSVEHFAARFPDDEIHLLIGADSLPELPTWRRWRDLLAGARLVVLARPEWPLDRSLARLRAELPAELAERLTEDRVTLVPNPPVAVSSTAIRKALAAGGEPPGESLHPLVLDYCRKYRLYR